MSRIWKLILLYGRAFHVCALACGALMELFELLATAGVPAPILYTHLFITILAIGTNRDHPVPALVAQTMQWTEQAQQRGASLLAYSPCTACAAGH